MASSQRDYHPDNGERIGTHQPPLLDAERFTERHGDPMPDPTKPPGCPYDERCTFSTPERRCGFWGVYRMDGRPGWVGCRRWHGWDREMAGQVEGGDD